MKFESDLGEGSVLIPFVFEGPSASHDACTFWGVCASDDCPAISFVELFHFNVACGALFLKKKQYQQQPNATCLFLRNNNISDKATKILLFLKQKERDRLPWVVVCL